MVRALDASGNGIIVPSLAGQALSGWAPRGLARLTAGAEGGAAATGALMLHNPAVALSAAPALALSSSWLMGEAAYYVGKTAPTLGNAAKRALGNGSLPLLLQSAKQPQQFGMFGSAAYQQ